MVFAQLLRAKYLHSGDLHSLGAASHALSLLWVCPAPWIAWDSHAKSSSQSVHPAHGKFPTAEGSSNNPGAVSQADTASSTELQTVSHTGNTPSGGHSKVKISDFELEHHSTLSLTCQYYRWFCALRTPSLLSKSRTFSFRRHGNWPAWITKRNYMQTELSKISWVLLRSLQLIFVTCRYAPQTHRWSSMVLCGDLRGQRWSC